MTSSPKTTTSGGTNAFEEYENYPKPPHCNPPYSVLQLVTHEDIEQLTAAITRLADILDGECDELTQVRKDNE